MKAALRWWWLSLCLWSCAASPASNVPTVVRTVAPKVAPREAIPSREAVVAYARRYVELPWHAAPQNQFHDVDPDGIRIDTAEASYAPGGWSVGDNVGVAYAWGGFDTPEEFLRKIDEGQPAGYVPRSHRARVSEHAAGVDCSGLVSRSWGLRWKYSTAELPQVSVRLDSVSELLPGDILDKPGGHVMLFEAFTDATRSSARFIEGGTWDGRAWKVTESTYSLPELLEAGFVPMRDARR